MLPNGKVLVAETLVPPGNEPAQIKSIDAVMLAVTGGLERTEAQYASLFDAAGLRLERVIETRGPISILEAAAAERACTPRLHPVPRRPYPFSRDPGSDQRIGSCRDEKIGAADIGERRPRRHA